MLQPLLDAPGEYSITALVRNVEKAKKLEAVGVKTILGSLDDSDKITKGAAAADIVLDFVCFPDSRIKVDAEAETSYYRLRQSMSTPPKRSLPVARPASSRPVPLPSSSTRRAQASSPMIQWEHSTTLRSSRSTTTATALLWTPSLTPLSTVLLTSSSLVATLKDT